MGISDIQSKSSFMLYTFTYRRVMYFHSDGKGTSYLFYKWVSETFLSFFSVRKDLSGLDDVTLTSQSECGGEI